MCRADLSADAPTKANATHWHPATRSRLGSTQAGLSWGSLIVATHFAKTIHL